MKTMPAGTPVVIRAYRGRYKALLVSGNRPIRVRYFTHVSDWLDWLEKNHRSLTRSNVFALNSPRHGFWQRGTNDYYASLHRVKGLH